MHNVEGSCGKILEDLQEANSVKGQALFLGPARLLFPVSCETRQIFVEESEFSSILSTTDAVEQNGPLPSDELSLLDKSANLTCLILGIPEFLNILSTEIWSQSLKFYWIFSTKEIHVA